MLLFPTTYAQTEVGILDILKSNDEYSEIIAELRKYPEYSVNILFLDSEVDSTDFAKITLSKKLGDIFSSSDKSEFYKVNKSDSSTAVRCRYIIFDGNVMTVKKIDALKKKIMKRLDNGESFVALVKEYSKEAERESGGDHGWMDSKLMNPSYCNAFINHNKGDVFESYDSVNNWHFIVSKTHDNKITRTVAMIVIKREH